MLRLLSPVKSSTIAGYVSASLTPIGEHADRFPLRNADT